MTDIFDIKEIIIGVPFSYLNTFFVIIIFIILLIILFLLKNKKPKIKEIIQEQKEIKIDFKALLSSFETRYLNLDSIDFLKESNHIFRLYLEQEKKYKNFSKLTLEEIINQKLENDHISFLKDLYYKEYREQVLDNDEKKVIFDDLVKIISN